MTVELGESFYTADVIPPISPTLTIYPSLDFEGFVACNNYFGSFSYDPVGDKLMLDYIYTKSNDCTYPSHNVFEDHYFNQFYDPADEIYYGVSQNSLWLAVYSSPGYDLYYQDTPLPLSVQDINDVAFIIYPNPVSNTLFISSENTLIENITVYSVLGEKVMELTAKGINSIDVSRLSEGLYFLKITTSEGKSIQKFIKK